MIPDDPELRRALDARSAPPTAEFEARFRQALDRGRPTTNWMPAVAAAIAAVIAIASVGVLLAAHNLNRPLGGGIASGARTPTVAPTPSKVALPSSAYLSAPSRDVAWAFVDYRLLFVSQDHGENWQLRQIPQGTGCCGPVTFTFADAENGWALFPGSPATQCQGAGAEIWRTSDGAKTWHRVASVDGSRDSPSGLGAAQCKEFISFVDRSDGFVDAWDDNSPPTIYRTTDGGFTWKPSRLPDPPGFKTSGGGFTLHASEVYQFGKTLLVTAYGTQPSGEGKGYVFRSTDGGATWTYAATVPNQAPEIAFVTESRWLQVIEPDQSVETTDAGRSWHAYASDYGQAAGVPPQVVFGDESVGYATVRGSIQRTEDGGLRWSYIKTPGT